MTLQVNSLPIMFVHEEILGKRQQPVIHPKRGEGVQDLR